MLVLSLVLMGVATFLIGCLPTFDSIGILAPILLVAVRFAQGIGVGGEWGRAVLTLVEHAAPAAYVHGSNGEDVLHDIAGRMFGGRATT